MYLAGKLDTPGMNYVDGKMDRVATHIPKTFKKELGGSLISANFVEIGGMLKKGLGHKVVENFSTLTLFQWIMLTEEKEDLFDIQQFGDASETEILTMIVKERKATQSLINFYNFLKLTNENNGVIYKFNTINKITV